MRKEIEYKRFPRRKLSTESSVIPDASLSARVLIDRSAKGLPVNAALTKHIPLPPDGNIVDDFVTGTEEILDVTDAVEYADRINSELQYIAEQKEKARQESIGGSDPVPSSIETAN